MKSRGWIALALVAVGSTSVATNAAGQTTVPVELHYPTTKTVDQIDDYFGEKVADPYRWLESVDAPETKDWIAAENKVTESYLAAIPERAKLVKRLTALYDYERRSVVAKVHGVLFFSRNMGLQGQPVLFKQDDSASQPVLLLDPNKLSKDGTVAVAGLMPSDDVRYAAYATSDGGSDWRTWHVRDLATMQDTSDVLVWSKFSGIAWAHDSSGFFYGRYPTPKPGAERQAANYDQKLYFHRLGDGQEKDALVYERPDHNKWMFDPQVTDDGRYLLVNVSEGTDRRNRVYWKDLSSGAGAKGAVAPLLDDFDANYDFIGNRGTTFYFKTDLDAVRGRVIAIDVTKPARAEWKQVVAEAQDQLNGASMVNGELVLNYLHDASSNVKITKLDGSLDRELALPGIGSASGFGGKNDDAETFYAFMSFTMPPTIFRYDFKSGASETWFAPKVDFDASPYETRLIFAVNPQDSTRVPIHVTCRKDLKLDGTHPCYLYGYGGFNIPMTPTFSTQRLVWLEMGGVYAQAMLRGGSEYGEEWHKYGMLSCKQNVFNDFIACAEHLIKTGYTTTPKLAIAGGSNGGLLVGACLTQRPDLFGAAVPAVGVLDMLRYHQFTIGWAWASEYGRSDDPDQFWWLYKYSPLHNVKPGTKYPPTLVLTGDHDDRVMPAHSFKFAATLQKAQSGPAPTLIRIETRAGHGAGKSTQMLIDEQADVYAFLMKSLGITMP